jgi:ketosteroid isomerase-like protein
MPTKETLDRFIARVESNAHAEAALEFYAMDCVIRENQSEPRYGRDLQVDRERALIARASAISSRCVLPIFQAGDRVAIRWMFEFHWPDGTTTRMDEIALQRWEGERIAEETFFYDPLQIIPKPTTAQAALLA